MTDRRFTLLAGAAAWLAVVVVLVVDENLDPTLRWVLVAVVALPAVWQLALLVLDLSVVKGWRQERREKRARRAQATPLQGVAEIDSKPGDRLEVWWWQHDRLDGDEWQVRVELHHRGRTAHWEGETARYPMVGVAYPEDFTGSIGPISHKLWQPVQARVRVEGLFDDSRRAWINRHGLPRRSWWAKLRSRIQELAEKGDPPPPYGVE